MSIKGKKVIVLKPFCNRRGYLKVDLYRDGLRNRVYVHRIMAKTFLSLPSGKQVHHKDCNPGNNSLSNLEVVSWGKHKSYHYAKARVDPDIEVPF